MNPPIFLWLSSDSIVTSLLTHHGQLNVFQDEIPNPPFYPAVRWSLIAGSPENYMGQRPGIDNGRFQFDVYAPTQESAKQIDKAISDVLEEHGHVVNFNGTGRETDTRQFFRSFDMSFWQNRA